MINHTEDPMISGGVSNGEEDALWYTPHDYVPLYSTKGPDEAATDDHRTLATTKPASVPALRPLEGEHLWPDESPSPQSRPTWLNAEEFAAEEAAIDQFVDEYADKLAFGAILPAFMETESEEAGVQSEPLPQEERGVQCEPLAVMEQGSQSEAITYEDKGTQCQLALELEPIIEGPVWMVGPATSDAPFHRQFKIHWLGGLLGVFRSSAGQIMAKRLINHPAQLRPVDRKVQPRTLNTRNPVQTSRYVIRDNQHGTSNTRYTVQANRHVLHAIQPGNSNSRNTVQPHRYALREPQPKMPRQQ